MYSLLIINPKHTCRIGQFLAIAKYPLKLDRRHHFHGHSGMHSLHLSEIWHRSLCAHAFTIIEKRTFKNNKELKGRIITFCDLGFF
jgi:hypothetical protein